MHVFACIACDRLALSHRAHSITCSPACRVRLHRNPEPLRRLELIAARFDITVASIREVAAVVRLRPDLEPRVMSGELTIQDVRADVVAALLTLIAEARPSGTDEEHNKP